MSVDLSASIQSLERRRLHAENDEELRTLTIGIINEKLHDDEEIRTVPGIEIRKQNISSIDKEAFLACEKLKTLTLSRNKICSFPTTKPIKGKFIPHLLQELMLDHNHITTVYGISELHNLQHLSLMDNCLGDDCGLELLSHLIKLKTLTLEGNRLKTIAGINFPQLEFLNISRNQLKTLDGCKMSRLTDLRASHNKLTTLDGIEKLLALQDLDVSYNFICAATSSMKSDSIASHRAAAAMSPLRTLQNLSSLNLRYNKLKSLSWISPLPHLTELLVGFNNLQAGHGMETASQISRTPKAVSSKAETPISSKNNSIQINYGDEIGQAEYASEDEGVVVLPRQTTPKRIPSRCGSSVSRRTSATVTSNAVGRNPLLLISKHCPLLESLDISNNCGFVRDYSCLRVLSKLNSLVELRIANSTELEMPDISSDVESHHQLIYSMVNTLEIIDDYSVVKVNRLELTDLNDEKDSSSEKAESEVSFVKTSKIESFQGSGNAWSTPGLRPSTATIDRPGTASKRPPMKAMTQNTSIGKSISVTDCKEMMEDLMQRMLFVKRNVDTKVKSLTNVLAALPQDVTKLPSAIPVVENIMKGPNNLSVDLDLSDPPTPTEVSLSPTPPPQPQKLKLSNKPAVKPTLAHGRALSNPALLGLKKKPHHLQKRSPQRLGRNLSFAEEQGLAKAKVKTDKEIDEAILYHHISKMDLKKSNSSSAMILQRKGSLATSSECGTQAGDSHIQLSESIGKKISSSTCTDDNGLPRPSSTPSIQSQSSVSDTAIQPSKVTAADSLSTVIGLHDARMNGNIDSSLPERIIVKSDVNHKPEVLHISDEQVDDDMSSCSEPDLHEYDSDKPIVLKPTQDIRSSYNPSRDVTVDFPVRPSTPETTSASTPCRTPQSLSLTITSSDQVPSIPKRPAGKLNIRSQSHKAPSSNKQKIKNTVIVSKQAARGSVAAVKEVSVSATSMRSLNSKMKRSS